MQTSFASVFTSNMVLQQGGPIPIWGKATPGAAITVSFRGQTAVTTAGADGKWKVKLGKLSASAEPATVELLASNAAGATAKASLTNVLTGEVWLCSGQSNMQWAVVNSINASEEIAAAKYPLIRLLTVPNRPGVAPTEELPNGAWTPCTPESATNFSAVGYFFGRELHKKLGVPIGLIASSWGGTVAEAWTSKEGLTAHPELRSIYDSFVADMPQLLAKQAEWKSACAAIDERTRDVSNEGFARGWAGEAEPTGEWKEMDLPSVWQAKGLKFSGILWFRKVIDVPASWAGKDLKLSIGATDKADVTYFNGEKMGGLTMADRPDAWAVARVYTVPGRLVKAGRNVIAVRVYSEKYAGGMTGPTEVMHAVSLGVEDARPIGLAGIWKYAIEANYGFVEYPPAPMGPDNPNAPTVLYNGMIHPLVPMALRGAIWYQGESNAGRARQYRELFKTLIKDWRRAFGNDALAFYFVQLANYMSTPELPADTAWANLREAQTMALALPHTGMAVAIDIGESNDIHPRNKQDVGLRLALNALHQTYGQSAVVPCGPLYRSCAREGNAMRLAFDHADGLQSRGGDLRSFAIAGTDKQFVWAKARIDGKTLVVSADSVREPVAVRYGWSDNPLCNLYNGAGLPASPFRTDVD